MPAVRKDLLKLLLLIGWGIDVVFLSHLLRPQSCLAKSAGSRTAQITADQRIEAVHGKRLLCQQYPAPGPVHDSF